jgi:hypothetical protein
VVVVYFRLECSVGVASVFGGRDEVEASS